MDKRLLMISSLVISWIMITVPAYTAWYIVNIDNEVIAKTEYKPSVKDLESRNEIAIEKDLDIPLRKAEYRGNKIVEHVKTKYEIEEEQKAQEKAEELQMIRNQMELEALKALKAKGEKFKYISEETFE